VDPDQELLELARQDIGLNVAMRSATERGAAELEAKQSTIRRRMRELQHTIAKRDRRAPRT
jgi:hypothetical protein